MYIPSFSRFGQRWGIWWSRPSKKSPFFFLFFISPFHTRSAVIVSQISLYRFWGISGCLTSLWFCPASSSLVYPLISQNAFENRGYLPFQVGRGGDDIFIYQLHIIRYKSLFAFSFADIFCGY